MQEVDFFVIGAGIAGLTFHRYLESDSVVVADFHPGRYKIGESIIPQHFFPRELRPVLEEARKLPSASEKLGTMFVSDDAVSFFHAFFDADYTIHLDRQELEALYRKTFDVPILEERVVDIDFERKIVRTETKEFHVRRQIVDCSGPAMVVARKLGIVDEVWPVWAGWAYWDVTERRDDRFWTSLREKGTPFYRFDDVSLNIAPAPIDDELRATETTMLTRFRDGVWTWQIPLYHASLLSFGVVTRHGQVSREQYLEIAQASLGAQYDARMREWDGSGPHNQFHRRDRFAWAARQFASPDWLLVGDAAFFGDPVYSVGTGVATNQAIRAATLINRFGWESGAWKAFDRRTAEIFQRAKAAYNHWYAGAVTTTNDVAQTIQLGFLNGHDLHFSTSEAYVDMWNIASPEDPTCDPCYDGDPAQHREALPLEVLPEDMRRVRDWTLAEMQVQGSAMELEWRRGEAAPLAMTVELREARKNCFQAAGPFALSYKSRPDAPYALDEHGRKLFEEFARVLMQHQRWVLSLMEGDQDRARLAPRAAVPGPPAAPAAR